MILEVGLGGRFDAVNAFDADCAVITSIALDHIEYLGDDREAIGFEKAQHHARRQAGHRQRPAAAGQRASPTPRRSAPTCGWWAATSTTAATASNGAGAAAAGATTAWPTRRCAAPTSCSTRRARIAAFEALRERLPITAQAVRNGLALVELPGRFQIVPGQPTLVLDVAHNPQAVAALALNLDAMGFYPRTHAVFGAMRDKDIAGAAGAAWRRWSTPGTAATCRTPRAATAAELAQQVHAAVAGQRGAPVAVHTHASPADGPARRPLAGGRPRR